MFDSSTSAYVFGAKFRSAFRFGKPVERFSILKQVIQARYNDSYTLHLMVSTNQTVSGELNGDDRNWWELVLGNDHVYSWLLIGRRHEGIGKARENLKRANHALSIIIPGHFFNLQYFIHCFMPVLFLCDSDSLSKSLSLKSLSPIATSIYSKPRRRSTWFDCQSPGSGAVKIYPRPNCKSPTLDASN